MSNKILLIVLGWEDRFEKGFEYDFNTYKFNQCILFCYKEYLEVTKPYLDFVTRFCKQNKIVLSKPILENENALENWKEIESVTAVINERDVELILDISTTPRETLWTILFFLKQSFVKIPYIYHKPLSYSEEWLSREPENPRLLFKHSGIIKFEKSTLLFILTGFDSERVRQLVNFYEPKKTILFIQEGSQFNNAIRNSKDNLEDLELSDVETYSSNSYDLLKCYKEIKDILDRYSEEFNIVATSLGPKISGLALYKYFNENPTIALSYVPCKQYNIDYSKGWDGAISGEVDFSENIEIEDTSS